MRNREYWFLIMLVFLDFAVKFFLLSKRQYYIDYDETYYMLLARNFFRGSGYTLNGLYNIVFPPLLPWMIGLFTILTGSEILSLRLISALSETLTLIPIYFLLRKIQGNKIAVYTLVLVSSQLTFFSFLNFNANYFEVFYMGSEFLYGCLLFAGLYYSFTAFAQEKKTDFILAAIFFAAAFLVRPEAIIYFMLVLIFYICSCFFKKTNTASNNGSKIFLYFCVFCLLLSPYLYYLYNAGGRLILNGKLSAGASLRESMITVFEKNDWRKFNSVHYRYDAANKEMDSSYWGVDKGKNVPFKKIPKIDKAERREFSRFFSSNVKNYFIGMKILYHPYLWIFAFFGLLATILGLIENNANLSKELFLGLGFINSLIIGCGLYMIPRHHVILIPIICFYTARGIFFLMSKFRKDERAINLSAAVVLVCIIGVYIVQSYISGRNLVSSEKLQIAFSNYKVALELKKYNPDVVMSWHPSIAYYAGCDWQVMPLTTLPNIIEFALKKKVNYIVVSKLEGAYRFDRGADPQNYLVYDTGSLIAQDKIVDFENIVITEKYSKDSCKMYTLSERR